jgi:SAM-dependent methyltransferase
MIKSCRKLSYCCYFIIVIKSLPLIYSANQPFVHRWDNNYRNLHQQHNKNKNKVFESLEKLWNDINVPKRVNLLKGKTLTSAASTFPYNRHELQKQDETDDFIFYSHPRFVKHIDEEAINALKSYYKEVLSLKNSNGEQTVILDLCSSWVSHLPKDFTTNEVIGLGMNEEELKANRQLNTYVIQNLNSQPTLPFEDNRFDYVLNAVSVDYITKPQEVFQEIFRILKPGGMCINSFSNRYFPTKVVNIWLRASGIQRTEIVGNYFSSTNFTNISAFDISPADGRSDPMYVVQATKKLSHLKENNGTRNVRLKDKVGRSTRIRNNL